MSRWTPEQDEQLHQLYVVERLDAATVAKAMGRVSRSSILGRAQRKGWVRRDMAPAPRRIWTEADKAVLVGHLNAGVGRRQCAKLMGCTEQSVKHLIIKWGLGRTSTFWTAARVAEIKERYAKGESYSEIGDALGVARGVISGKVHRLGLSASGAPRSSKSHRVSRSRRPAVELRRDPTPVRRSEEIGPVKLMDLTFHHCRWPLAMHGGEQTFCGRQRAHETTSYCAEHKAASVAPFYPKQPKTPAALARSLRKYAA